MSAATEASRKLVELLFADQAKRWRVYSYRQDFSDLWEALRTHSFGTGIGGIIVVFDEVPKVEAPADSLIPTAEYVTAYDWMVTWLSGLTEEPQCRLVLLDIAPGSALAGKLVTGFLSVLYWVRTERVETGLRIFSALCDSASGRSASPDWRAARDGLRDLWISRLTRPGKRHEVSNLLAPFVMAHDLRARDWPGASVLVAQLESDLLRRALVVQVEALGILQATRDKKALLPRRTEFRIERLAETDPFGRFAEQVRFMLVDDQFDLGYREIVQCLLFGDSTVSHRGSFELVCRPRPDELVEWLENHLRQPEPRLIGKNCILLLDLRLFASRPNGEAEEKRFLKRLLRLYDSIPLRSPALQDAADAARAQVAGTTSREGLAYLAFLPLLLSHADPSLPIVLFTSSHQRVIWKAVEDRPNIITGFAKPIVSGYAPGGPGGDAIDDLIEAITDALRLHKIRIVWEALVAFSRRLPISVSEPGLFTSDASEVSYSIDFSVVSVLAAEFESLLARRRYADALLIPDNVLDRAEAKVKCPEELRNIELMCLAEARAEQNKDWHSFVADSLSDSILSPAVRTVFRHCLVRMKRQNTRRRNEAIDKLIECFYKPESVPDGWREVFKTLYSQQAKILEDEFTSIENFLDLAFSNAERKVLQSVDDAASKLAAYEFYSVLAAMRNARAHFRVGANQHEELEDYAIWTWLWFLLGCGRRAATVGPVANRESLLLAKREAWFSRPTFGDEPGEEFCRQVVAGLGHMVRLGILNAGPEVQAPVAYALRLAQADTATVRVAVEAPSGPAPAQPPESIRTTTEVSAGLAASSGAGAGGQALPDARNKPSTVAPPQKARRGEQPRRWPAGATYRPFAELQKLLGKPD